MQLTCGGVLSGLRFHIGGARMERPPLSETASVPRKWRRDFRSRGKARFILWILWFGVIGFGGWMFVAVNSI